MQTPFKAAVVQAGSILGDTRRTLEKLSDLTAEAARQGAKLVLFPEAFVGGYPKGMDFGAKLGLRTNEGREQFRRYFECAIDAGGAQSDAIAEIARVNGVYLVTGVIERDVGTLYCSVFHYSPKGAFLGKHRKLMPTALERLVWGFGDGSTLSVFDTNLGRLGSVICWENYMPLLRTAMYAKNIQIYCAPTVDDREVWFPSMRMIALEGRCFVLSACQFLPNVEMAADPLLQSSACIRGGSSIIGPLGQVLSEPFFDREGVAVAEVDPREIVRAKYDFDVVGHYSRPDIFELKVNERAMSAVRTADEC